MFAAAMGVALGLRADYQGTWSWPGSKRRVDTGFEDATLSFARYRGIFVRFVPLFGLFFARPG